jgi:hypothetical protein
MLVACRLAGLSALEATMPLAVPARAVSPGTRLVTVHGRWRMREGHLPESLWLYGANSANRSDFLPI